MTDCTNTEARDALPELAHGRLGQLDTATMSAHVESCPDCQAELALLREVRDTAPLAPGMDAERISAAILPYGGASVYSSPQPRPTHSFARRYALPLAAAALLVAVGAISTLRGGKESPASAEQTAPATASVAKASPEVGAPAIAAVATEGQTPAPAVRGNISITAERRVASLSLVGGTQDLTEAQLETLLSEIDGMETIPSAEPQAVTPSVEDIEGDQ